MQLRLSTSGIGFLSVRELLNASLQQAAPPADTSSSQHTAGKLRQRHRTQVTCLSKSVLHSKGHNTKKLPICQQHESWRNLTDYAD